MRKLLCYLGLSCVQLTVATAQQVTTTPEKLMLTAAGNTVTFHKTDGSVDYVLAGGIKALHTSAYCKDLYYGSLSTVAYKIHTATVKSVKDVFGEGKELVIEHKNNSPVKLIQHIRLYNQTGDIIIDFSAARSKVGHDLETRDISPLAVLPGNNSKLLIAGSQPRILDFPFDNDNWVGGVARSWAGSEVTPVAGISYELAAVYDYKQQAGMAIGSIRHDFWKTGIQYKAGKAGVINSMIVYGGAATADNRKLPALYGGLDGTHDLVAHGTMKGATVTSPQIFISSGININSRLRAFGQANVTINGRLDWKAPAPVYWNSFGAEGVLGSEGVMMPEGVRQVSDYLRTLKNFSSISKPVLSIDSYSQNIYTTEVLHDIGEYGAKNGQQMGFYFIPFALWTWKDQYEGKKLQGTDYLISDVLLRDDQHQPILYKDGKFCAYALDPTHPAIRELIITQLQKAKKINAKFLKIDFLEAGALESNYRYDKSVRTGMQAYDKGMKMLKELIDQVMGKDIFITLAISPMFPSQYAHTRFVSTDVYSHLRDDEPGFPHYGSTEASLATGSYMTWVQGTLWPYTNLDVCIMKNFQKNPVLTETEIKVRLYAMAVMGSILGDGSDLRDTTAKQRAEKFLNNPKLVELFSKQYAFKPVKPADGDDIDQQMAFCRKDVPMLAAFNFSKTADYKQIFSFTGLGLDKTQKYQMQDLLTGQVVGTVVAGQSSVQLSVGTADAVLVKLIPIN